MRAKPGEFAVEFRGLTANGVTRSDLAWLVRNGYVVHAREVTRPDDPARRFRPAKSLRFTETSCFIATAEGMALTTVEHCTKDCAARREGRETRYWQSGICIRTNHALP